MTCRRSERGAALVLAIAACTYGPVEEEAKATQVIRLGDSYRAVVVLQHSVLRQPTGWSTFPDGGKVRFLERGAAQFLIDASSGRAIRLASQDAPDSLWESFGAYVAGLEGDSAMYLRLIGCPRGGECHPSLQKKTFVRLTVNGDLNVVDRVPSDAVLPGSMLARAPGERHYVRFSVSADTITARLEEGGPYRPLFLVEKDASLTAIGELTRRRR